MIKRIVTGHFTSRSLRNYTIVNHGFSAFELLLSLGFIATISIMVLHLLTNAFDNTKWQADADIITKLGQIANNYLQNNYATIKQIMRTTNSYTISYAQLQQSGFVPPEINLTAYHEQIPCLLLLGNNTHIISAFLVFVNNNQTNAPTINQSDAWAISSLIGSAGGYIDNLGNAVNANHGWRIDQIATLLDVNKCLLNTTTPNLEDLHNTFTTIATLQLKPYSPVLNISLLTEFNMNALHDDELLRTKLDSDNNPLGNANNMNTITTDISFARQQGANIIHQSIVFDKNTHLKLSGDIIDNNKVAVTGGGFSANTIIPSTNNITLNIANQPVGSACLANEQGTIISENINDASGQLIANQLHCTYSPIMCRILDNKTHSNLYCYLPLMNTKITYSFNINNLPASVNCPSGLYLGGDVEYQASNCSCPNGGKPTTLPNITYIGYSYLNLPQINVGAKVTCQCSNGEVGGGQITQMTCYSSSPPVIVMH